MTKRISLLMTLGAVVLAAIVVTEGSPDDKDASASQVYEPSRLSYAEYTAVGDPTKSQSELKSLKGVYTHKFQNENVDGSKYESIDMIKVLPLDSLSAYVSLEVFGYNGHGCMFNGVLTYTPIGDYMYRGPNRECALTMRTLKDEMVFGLRTEENCFCGSRMSIRDYSISLNSRQGIEQSNQIFNSDEYTESIKIYSAFLTEIQRQPPSNEDSPQSPK